jgi:hypothetical protein
MGQWVYAKGGFMTIQEGTVIHGTLRTQDLIEAFMDCLDSIEGHRAYHRFNECQAMMADAYEEDGVTLSEDWFDTEQASELLERLFDCLDELAPAGMYFGAHEGDGSDFGFWGLNDIEKEDGIFGAED